MIGVNPESFTLRELMWMADGQQKAMWNHTATLQAQIINSNGGGKNRKPVDPKALIPRALIQDRVEKPPQVGIEALKILVK